jgi:glucosamine--fructose-6-phosphate aminotransferase (isomerizing)
MLKDTHLYQDIFGQPGVLHQVLGLETQNIQRLADDIRHRKIQHVVIAARGTSDNAGRYAQYLLGAVNRLVVGLATPSLFTIYHTPPNFGNSLILGISQSGKSPDIVAVLAEARRQGALTAAITNEPNSDLAGEAGHIINLHAGVERAVAATKTYTSELMIIALLSASLAGDAQMHAELREMPDILQRTLQMDEGISKIAPRYRYMRDCVVIGRGYNYATAFEIALKLKELTYTIVEPHSSADFLHGPLAVIEYGFPAIVIAPSGKMAGEMENFLGRLDQRQAEILLISDDPAMLEKAHIAMHLANVRGYDLDQPRAIRKVTETR